MPRPYTRYTLEQRSSILAIASAEGLTARAVQARFGVNPHTYYVWRRQAGLRGPRGRRPRSEGAQSCRPSARVAQSHQLRSAPSSESVHSVGASHPLR
jgi:transposase-like protein